MAFTRYARTSSSRRGSPRLSPSNYRERVRIIGKTIERERERERERVYGEVFASATEQARKSRLPVRPRAPTCAPKYVRNHEKKDGLLCGRMRLTPGLNGAGEDREKRYIMIYLKLISRLSTRVINDRRRSQDLSSDVSLSLAAPPASPGNFVAVHTLTTGIPEVVATVRIERSRWENPSPCSKPRADRVEANDSITVSIRKYSIRTATADGIL